MNGALPTVHLRAYDGIQRSHHHAFHQVVLPLAGALQMEISHHGGAVQGGCAAIIPAAVRHSFCATGDNRFLVVDAAPDDVFAPLWDVGVSRPFVTFDPALGHLIRYLRAEVTDRRGTGAALAHGGATLLHALRERDTGREAGHARPIDRALAIIHRDFHRRLTAQAIAAAAGLSVSHLHALFRQDLGTTPMRYLADRRLDHAMALLRSSRLSIAEIALRCGFADQSALTRSLRRHRNLTPAAYRSLGQNNRSLRQSARRRVC